MKIIIPYTARYPDIHKALQSRRFCVLVAHRRFGKTVLAVIHLIKSALICKKQGGHFAYVAPFRTQAKSVAWDYLKHYTAKIPKREINQSELAITIPSAGGRAKIRIFGADNPDALRGLYFDGVVLDEVAQMKPDVWEEIIQPALADRLGFAVFIGTPKGMNLFSDLYYHAIREQAMPDSQWLALCYPVTETNALDKEEVARLKTELSDNKYRQEMLCDFSASNDNTLITLDEAKKALEIKPNPELARPWPLIIGVDVARFGDDASVFYKRQGNMAMPPVIMRKLSNTELAQKLVSTILESKPKIVNIDQGQGTGVIDLVRELVTGRSVVINEIPFGSRALESDKYTDRRCEMWTRMRDWIRHGGSISANREVARTLLAELTAPTYDFANDNRMRLEQKKDIRKRLKHSTDIGDALALTFAVDTRPDENILFANQYAHKSMLQENHQNKMYDPFA